MAPTSAFLVALLIAPFVLASAQTTVDWTLGKSYTSYSTQSLKAGGTIVFNYDKASHNVLVVSKSDYDNCVTSNPITKYTDGKSSIPLKQGAMYFICGFPTHCSNGMKLQVNVASGDSTTPATPATPATPSSTPAPTDSGSSTPSTTSPAPKDSNGAADHSSASQLMYVVPLVLGTLFAFMS